MGINSVFGLFRTTFQRRIRELEVEKTKKRIIHPQERPGLPPNLACPIGVQSTICTLLTVQRRSLSTGHIGVHRIYGVYLKNPFENSSKFETEKPAQKILVFNRSNRNRCPEEWVNTVYLAGTPADVQTTVRQYQ